MMGVTAIYNINDATDHNKQLIVHMCDYYGTAKIKDAFSGTGMFNCVFICFLIFKISLKS